MSKKVAYYRNRQENCSLHSDLARNSTILSVFLLSLSLSPIPRSHFLIFFNLPIVKVNERLTMTSLTDLYMNHVVVGPPICPISLYNGLPFSLYALPCVPSMVCWLELGAGVWWLNNNFFVSVAIIIIGQAQTMFGEVVWLPWSFSFSA